MIARMRVGHSGAVVGNVCRPDRTICRAPPGTVVHVVLLKLNDPSGKQALKKSCREDVAAVGAVLRWTHGAPIETGRGDQIDSTYDVGLTFELAGVFG